MKTYPMIQFVVKHGRKIALGVALAVLVMGAYAWMVTGLIGCLIGGLLLAGGAFFVLLVFIEVVEVIADTLLPR